MQESYGKEHEIEDIHVRLHQVEQELHVLKTWQVVFGVKRLVDVDEHRDGFLHARVLIVVGELGELSVQLNEVFTLGRGERHVLRRDRVEVFAAAAAAAAIRGRRRAARG